ncbi:mannose-6-phosphate isomerase, class I [Flavihumibacter petaseus]|uniref:mannose-6-phosphate isomerase n=1 Tax=Flavihumibacter petaseus NBRC 106054 TaxID=1220578 RepID=A0A0E9MZC5_9BACT|nr:mannose-6-phosphate isomerase, class I [Flavihumibacter petaseus]GAO42969.1 mannose-6-phosphate isomerase [Flavihumibacter petaseus NBRC 106054]
MQHQNKVFALEGKVQHYQWGGFTYLPQLLSRSNSRKEPFAEYWLGAHAQAPAQLIGSTDLHQLLQDNPSLLGEKVKKTFGRLPYLLKILDVKDMLSIQVHPTRESAIEGFAAENAKGIALTAPNRNYKDDNHKPEVMVALSEFYLLHGFRAVETMKAILTKVPELNFLLEVFGDGDYRALYSRVMEMPAEEVKATLQPLLDRIVPAYESGSIEKSDPDFWAARAALTYKQEGTIDRGIFSVYLLNLVQVQEGQGVFQDAGILHAYLEGQNVELMANSDNVLRGGLTPKYIDVPELMKHVRFEPVVPHVLEATPVNTVEAVYKTPAPDFELHSIKLGEGEKYSVAANTVDILIVLEGDVVATENDQPGIEMSWGDSLLLLDGAELTLEARSPVLIYRSTTP